MNITKTTYVPPARVSADALKALLDMHNLSLDISWRWSGWNRSGVLRVIDDTGVRFERQYRRATQLWGRGDETLERMRTGSPKHEAVMAALAALS